VSIQVPQLSSPKVTAGRRYGNLQEFAAHVGIRPSTAYSWLESGKYTIPHLRLGKLYKFDLTPGGAVDQWLKTMERQ
jgi:hypothetical protein